MHALFLAPDDPLTKVEITWGLRRLDPGELPERYPWDQVTGNAVPAGEPVEIRGGRWDRFTVTAGRKPVEVALSHVGTWHVQAETSLRIEHPVFPRDVSVSVVCNSGGGTAVLRFEND